MRNAPLLMALACLSPTPVAAFPYWVTGSIYEVTTTSDGLMFRINNPSIVPDNCVNAAGNWFLIPNGDQVMAAFIMSMWLSGRKNFTIYTSPTVNNYCRVTQADPLE